MKDPRLSVPSVAIPYGQRFISLDLASQDELVGTVGRGINATAPYTQDAVSTGGGLTTSSATLKTIELYINNIFVNPEVHNIFIKRIGFTLIRVHRKQIATTDGGIESILLQQLKWPIEALFVGVRPTSYMSDNAVERRANLDRWHKFSSVTDTPRTTQGWMSNQVTVTNGVLLTEVLTGPTTLTVDATIGNPFTIASDVTIANQLVPGQVLTFTNATGTAGPLTISSISSDGLTINFVGDDLVLGDPLLAFNGNELLVADSTTAFSLTVLNPAEVSSSVAVCAPTMEWVTIKAHGIPIYNHFPARFYNAYLPLNYGGPNIRTPDDCGALMITFCLYPGTYQPSGHINVSRAREFYIDFSTTSVINNNNNGTLVVIASAINFLLISDGLTNSRSVTDNSHISWLLTNMEKECNNNLIRQMIAETFIQICMRVIYNCLVFNTVSKIMC